MATKSKLERAVERQAATLNDAQKELILSQFAIYKRSKARIADVENKIAVIDMQKSLVPEKAKMQLAQRASLVSERSLLVEGNNEIAAKLFEQLGGNSEEG